MRMQHTEDDSYIDSESGSELKEFINSSAGKEFVRGIKKGAENLRASAEVYAEGNTLVGKARRRWKKDRLDMK